MLLKQVCQHESRVPLVYENDAPRPSLAEKLCAEYLEKHDRLRRQELVDLGRCGEEMLTDQASSRPDLVKMLIDYLTRILPQEFPHCPRLHVRLALLGAQKLPEAIGTPRAQVSCGVPRKDEASLKTLMISYELSQGCCQWCIPFSIEHAIRGMKLLDPLAALSVGASGIHGPGRTGSSSDLTGKQDFELASSSVWRVTTVDGAGGHAKDPRPPVFFLDVVIKILHNAGVWVVLLGVVSLVENQEVDLIHAHEAMMERLVQDVGRAHYGHVLADCLGPEVATPKFGLQLAAVPLDGVIQVA